MSEHVASITWKRETEQFDYASYNRDHEWLFHGGHAVPASAAPEYRGNPDRVDPESAFVASLSSCHMLTFLALCARKRFIVDRYEDDAVGHLEKNADGVFAMTRVELNPVVEFSGEHLPSSDELRELHDRAHHECFIANSVKTDVRVSWT
jgi:organic hydroperoxide reductase OsmC/OhrA